MDSEFKWFFGGLFAFFIFLFGGLFVSDYFDHQRDVACIEKGGMPFKGSCLFNVRVAP